MCLPPLMSQPPAQMGVVGASQGWVQCWHYPGGFSQHTVLLPSSNTKPPQAFVAITSVFCKDFVRSVCSGRNSQNCPKSCCPVDSLAKGLWSQVCSNSGQLQGLPCDPFTPPAVLNLRDSPIMPKASPPSRSLITEDCPGNCSLKFV